MEGRIVKSLYDQKRQTDMAASFCIEAFSETILLILEIEQEKDHLNQG